MVIWDNKMTGSLSTKQLIDDAAHTYPYIIINQHCLQRIGLNGEHVFSQA